MNHLRKAAEAGAAVMVLVQKDVKTGQVLAQRHNAARQAKKAFQAQGLSGRQIRKLRQQARREEAARRAD